MFDSRNVFGLSQVKNDNNQTDYDPSIQRLLNDSKGSNKALFSSLKSRKQQVDHGSYGSKSPLSGRSPVHPKSPIHASPHSPSLPASFVRRNTTLNMHSIIKENSE